MVFTPSLSDLLKAVAAVAVTIYLLKANESTNTKIGGVITTKYDINIRDNFCNIINQLKSCITEYNSKEPDNNEFLKKLELVAGESKSLEKMRSTMTTKQVYRSDNEFVKSYFDCLNILPEINHKAILHDLEFRRIFHTILENIQYHIAFVIGNIGQFIDRFIATINRITYPNYIIKDCSKVEGKGIDNEMGINNYDYNCGRAIMSIHKEDSKFLVFNTNNDGLPDKDIIIKYSPECENMFNMSYAYKAKGRVSEDGKTFMTDDEDKKKFDKHLSNSKGVPIYTSCLLYNLPAKFGYVGDFAITVPLLIFEDCGDSSFVEKDTWLAKYNFGYGIDITIFAKIMEPFIIPGEISMSKGTQETIREPFDKFKKSFKEYMAK